MAEVDRKNTIKHLLTREHCKMIADYAVKDLRLIGRDLKTTIIVDNLLKNFEETTPDNGIHIEDFEGSFDDNHLFLLKDFLMQQIVA